MVPQTCSNASWRALGIPAFPSRLLVNLATLGSGQTVDNFTVLCRYKRVHRCGNCCSSGSKEIGDSSLSWSPNEPARHAFIAPRHGRGDDVAPQRRKTPGSFDTPYVSSPCALRRGTAVAGERGRLRQSGGRFVWKVIFWLFSHGGWAARQQGE